MQSTGSVTKYLPFLDESDRHTLHVLMAEHESYTTFIDAMIDKICSEITSDSIISMVMFQLLDCRMVEPCFKISERHGQNQVVQTLMQYIQGVMGDPDAATRSLNLIEHICMSETGDWIKFKLCLLGVEIFSNLNLGNPVDFIYKAESYLARNPELKSLEHDLLYEINDLSMNDVEFNFSPIEQAIQLAREINDEIALANMLSAYATAYLRVDVQKAIELFPQSKALAVKYGLTLLQSEIMNNLGYAKVIVGEYDEAIKCYEQAFTINKSIGIDDFTTPLNMAVLYGNLGENDKALKWAESALESSKQTGSKNPAPYIEMARALALIGKVNEAMEFVEIGGELAFETGSRRELGRYYLVRGMIDRRQNDLESAILMFNRGLKIAESIQSPYHVLQILLQLAEADVVLLSQKKSQDFSEKSSVALSRMEQIANEQNLPGLKIQVAALKADVAQIQGKKGAARAILDNALTDCDKSGLTSMKGLIEDRLKNLGRKEPRQSLLAKFRELVRRVVIPQVQQKPVPFEVLGCLLIVKDAGIQAYAKYIDSRLTSDPALVAGLITAVSNFTQELREDTKGQLQSIIHQEIAVLLEHGNYVTCALLTDRDTSLARTLERAFLEEFEETFSEYLQDFDGRVGVFKATDVMFDSILVQRKLPEVPLEWV